MVQSLDLKQTPEIIKQVYGRFLDVISIRRSLTLLTRVQVTRDWLVCNEVCSISRGAVGKELQWMKTGDKLLNEILSANVLMLKLHVHVGGEQGERRALCHTHNTGPNGCKISDIVLKQFQM